MNGHACRCTSGNVLKCSGLFLKVDHSFTHVAEPVELPWMCTAEEDGPNGIFCYHTLSDATTRMNFEKVVRQLPRVLSLSTLPPTQKNTSYSRCPLRKPRFVGVISLGGILLTIPFSYCRKESLKSLKSAVYVIHQIPPNSRSLFTRLSFTMDGYL